MKHFGDKARNRVYSALMKMNRPCTTRELAAFMDVSSDYAADVLRDLHECGRVNRYKPKVEIGRAPLFYFPTSYRVNGPVASAIANWANKECMKSVSRMNNAWQTIGGWFTIHDFARSANVSYQSAHLYIKKQRRAGRAEKRPITNVVRENSAGRSIAMYRKLAEVKQ